MGQEIVYCYQCQTRLLGSDFERGLAFRVGAQVSCPACVRGLFSTLPPAEIDAQIARLKEAQVAKRSGNTGRFPVMRGPSPESSAKIKIVPGASETAAPPRSKLPLILGGAAVALGAILAIVASTSSSSRPATVAVDVGPAPSKPAPALPAPGADPGLPAGAFVDVDRLLAARIESDDYSAGARDLDKARGRRSESAWTAGIDERRMRLEAKALAALDGFVTPAENARREGREDEVDRLRRFIDAFPSVATEFDRRLGAKPEPSPVPPAPAPKPPPGPKPPAPPKPAPTEAATYRSKWEQAMLSRDPAAVTTSLQALAKGLKSADVKAEAARDLELLRLTVPVRAEGLAALTRLPKEQRVKLEFRDGAVTVGAVEGTVQSADAVRIRIATDSGTVDLPVSELSDETIARLYAGRAGAAPSDAQAAAAWCALRASVDGAAKLDPPLPDKYLEFSRKPAPPGPDAEERRAFWNVFVGFGMNRSRGAALEELSRLSSPRFKPFIDLLLEGAKEAFFSGTDFAVAGTFAASERDKVGTVWLSTVDLKTGAAALEAEYYALPDQTYRAWVLAGGCCQEVFSFSWQATGLKGVDPKTKQEASFEPGDAAGLPAKLPGFSLKKLHSQHTGPKEPDRWEWIPLVLPKADAAGLKKIRLLTDQKGFAVAHLVVSATRRGPPSATELKDLLRDRSSQPRFLIPPGPARGKPTRTAYFGGAGGAEFEDQAPSGAVLVGLKYSPKGAKGCMKLLQPIYRLGEKTSTGAVQGGLEHGAPEIVAKPGYAVGQVVLMASDRLDGFKIVFMRQSGGRLLAADSYESAWVGVPLKGEPKTLGDGSPVSGIFGHKGGEIDGFGLILLK
jgi:hypothetical protein